MVTGAVGRLTEFSAFINDLDNGAEHGLGRFVRDAKLGVAIDTQGSSFRGMLREMLEKCWANRNLLKFNKEKWHLKKNNLAVKG